MSDAYLTTPGSDKSHLLSKKENIFWDHKEATVVELQKLGVPLRPAELAVIDLRSLLYIAQKNKLTPNQTASMMFSEVERVYTDAEGNWHFQQPS